MNNPASTMKTQTDCDYIVYLNDQLGICGFEIAPDNLRTLYSKYNCDEKIDNIIPPKDTGYILEIFDISTILIWYTASDSKSNKTATTRRLLYYCPALKELAKEIINNIETVIPMETEDCVYKEKDETCRLDKGVTCGILKCSEFELPAKEEEKKKMLPVHLTDYRLKDILARVPYPNWLEECWGSPAWMQIWTNKPHLQEVMSEFAREKGKLT